MAFTESVRPDMGRPMAAVRRRAPATKPSAAVLIRGRNVMRAHDADQGGEWAASIAREAWHLRVRTTSGRRFVATAIAVPDSPPPASAVTRTATRLVAERAA
jgi:hypothetical protein